MARTPRPAKEPGRLKQMWQVFQMTRRYDGNIVWMLILALIAPIGAGIVISILFSSDNIIGIILYNVSGVLAGVLLVLIVLGRRAERAAFSQIEGQGPIFFRSGSPGSRPRDGAHRDGTVLDAHENLRRASHQRKSV